MHSFISDDFLLSNEPARRLFHDVAARQPILDFHGHLSPQAIAEDLSFANLFEIWLQGDHYKWRAMRAHGIDERFCTGDASPYDKFLAWSRTVPYTLRNPLYQWSHLELQRYFGISELLDERTAPSIWERANATLAGGLTARQILAKFRVQVLCTTDDAADDLRYHQAIAQTNLPTRILPTFRPDKALTIHLPEEFKAWIARLSSASGIEIRNLAAFLDALRSRHDFFHALGCRISDHGIEQCYSDPCSDRTAAILFSNVLEGRKASAEEHHQFASFLMLFFARLDAEKGWTKQLHLGALRNVNAPAYRSLGPDTGYDAIGNSNQIPPLVQYLDLLAQENALPRMIIYNLNPADTFAAAAAIGCFQSGGVPGRIQLGSAWWFLDQRQGITAQLEALSNLGLLSHFVGMVSDSRSFMSFPRHEYFRRVLCDLIGRDVERGELPAENSLLDRLVEDVCYRNAARYLRLKESSQ